MNRLWAPWRIGYIKSMKKEKGCLFCRLFKEKKDRKNYVLLRSRHSFCLLNLYPYNNGHLMVAPAKHVASLELLDDDELCDLMAMVKKMKILLDRVLKPQGYNIGLNIGRSAGAGFDRHIHVHIVPRWPGDINFMTTVSSTRIISQSLDALYKELVKNLP